MSCGIGLVKFALFSFNLVCALAGIAMAVFGIFTLVTYDDTLEQIKTLNFGVVPIIFIAVGAAIFLIACFGCCGALFESECMMLLYSVLLFLVLVGQIVLGVYVFLNKHEVDRGIERFMKSTWINRESNGPFWDGIQQLFHCCGNTHATEWGSQMPKSCCSPHKSECIVFVSTYPEGCLKIVQEFVGDKSNWFGGTALAVAGVEMIGFIFACCLSNHIRNRKRRLAY